MALRKQSLPLTCAAFHPRSFHSEKRIGRALSAALLFNFIETDLQTLAAAYTYLFLDLGVKKAFFVCLHPDSMNGAGRKAGRASAALLFPLKQNGNV